MNCGLSFLKFILTLFNFIFMIVGIVLIIVGGVVLHNVFMYNSVKGLEAGPILVISVGVIILVVSFFGCSGARAENICLSKTYAFFLVILLLANVAVVIASLLMRDKIEKEINSYLEKIIEEYDKDTNKDVIDNIQHTFHCCGSNNYTDWQTYYKKLEVPQSCCINQTEGCKTHYNPGEDKFDFYTQGCSSKFTNMMKQNLGTLAIIIGCVCLVEFVGILFAVCYARGLTSQYEPV